MRLFFWEFRSNFFLFQHTRELIYLFLISRVDLMRHVSLMGRCKESLCRGKAKSGRVFRLRCDEGKLSCGELNEHRYRALVKMTYINNYYVPHPTIFISTHDRSRLSHSCCSFTPRWKLIECIELKPLMEAIGRELLWYLISLEWIIKNRFPTAVFFFYLVCNIKQQPANSGKLFFHTIFPPRRLFPHTLVFFSSLPHSQHRRRQRAGSIGHFFHQEISQHYSRFGCSFWVISDAHQVHRNQLWIVYKLRNLKKNFFHFTMTTFLWFTTNEKDFLLCIKAKWIKVATFVDFLDSFALPLDAHGH